MKAIFFHKHGGVDVLQYGEIPEPEPGPGEVLIRLRAASLNRLDLWLRDGWPGIRLDYPHIPGADGAGEFAFIGEGVGGWQVGDRVVINPNLSCGKCEFCLAGYENRCNAWGLLGETVRGTYAEFITLPAINLYPVPDGFDMRAAAAAALVFQTAWHSLVTRAQIQPGETVLVIGSSMGTHRDFSQVMDLVFSNLLRPVLDNDFPFQEAGVAQARLEAGEQMGKITLHIP